MLTRILIVASAWFVALAVVAAHGESQVDAQVGAQVESPPPAGQSGAAPSADGRALYNRFCLACHGTYGDGRGPAAPWLWPRPRDFTRGEYKWRTTPTGSPPTDDDLDRVIVYGVPGTSMHGFGPALSDTDVAALIEYLKSLAPDAFTTPGQPIEIPPIPAITSEFIERGKASYQSLGCVACHGETGAGDGVAAANLRTASEHLPDGLPARPYDLTREPFRRPGPNSDIKDIFVSLATGLSGTPMPAYLGATTNDDLWAVAAYIDSIRMRGVLPAERNAPRIAKAAIRLDRKYKLTRKGYYAGNGTPEEMAIFGGTIPFQGPAPGSLTPAQRSLDAQQCARCHNKQVREWRGTAHNHTGSPGLIAQIVRMLRFADKRGRDNGNYAEDCQRCHAPLAEAQPVVRPGQMGGDDSVIKYRDNRAFDSELRTQGLNCASCHLRGWTRYGPPRVPDSRLLDAPGYPLVESEIYERSDFCQPCHQLTVRSAKNGRPFLDTYREWLEGPYMRRGVQCQHCHMPNREHTWKGVHDPDTFRQGIRLDAIAGRSAKTGAVSVRARITNVGAGHYLPTTPTPAAWLKIDLVDKRGVDVAGAHAELRIGRHLEFDGKFTEVEDTRIPPGESVELARAWKRGRVPKATHARVTVYVAPDEYYERLYRYRLGKTLDADVRAMFEEALAEAVNNRFTAIERLVPIR